MVESEGRETEPPTVYVEGFTGALYLDKPTKIERYSRVFAGIWGTTLGEAASRDLILQAAREFP